MLQPNPIIARSPALQFKGALHKPTPNTAPSICCTQKLHTSERASSKHLLPFGELRAELAHHEFHQTPGRAAELSAHSLGEAQGCPGRKEPRALPFPSSEAGKHSWQGSAGRCLSWEGEKQGFGAPVSILTGFYFHSLQDTVDKGCDQQPNSQGEDMLRVRPFY